MALTQSDRIAISKKLVDIPKEDATSLDNKTKLQEALNKAQQQDNANKTLFDDVNVFVNAYQNEIERYDGNDRLAVVEQDIVDSANQKFQNFFNPNDPATPLPSVPDGVWKNFIPFSGSKALGKKYNETYDTIPKEENKIQDVQDDIAIMEAFTAIQRSTGQSCTPVDIIADDPAIQTAATDTIASVNAWKTFLQGTLALIYTMDPNTTRQTQNNAAIADINNAINIINTWLALPTFDTNHGQTTCAGFNSYNVNLLQQTKFRADGLLPIKNELTARLAFIVTRLSQLNTNLGTVVQNFSTGAITSATGFYGQRFNILNLRLNLMNGSLRKVEGIKLGQKAQDEAVASNASAQAVYSSIMLVSPFRAPAQGNKFIHVKSATGFTMGDSVYVMADTQQEISATIVAVNGDMITLDKVIPKKYRQNDNARIYKIL